MTGNFYNVKFRCNKYSDIITPEMHNAPNKDITARVIQKLSYCILGTKIVLILKRIKGKI